MNLLELTATEKAISTKNVLKDKASANLISIKKADERDNTFSAAFFLQIN